MQHSEWATPTTEELKELEYTQLEENNGNGKGNTTTTVPVNGGILIVFTIVLLYGLWKQYRTSSRYISES